MSLSSVVRAPRASRRNPFRAGSPLAGQFDTMLKLYADGHKDVVLDGGKVRCTGNSWADNFWLGYESVQPVRVPKGTWAWACYRAGQAQRLIDNERGVYVPKTPALRQQSTGKANGSESR